MAGGEHTHRVLGRRQVGLLVELLEQPLLCLLGAVADLGLLLHVLVGPEGRQTAHRQREKDRETERGGGGCQHGHQCSKCLVENVIETRLPTLLYIPLRTMSGGTRQQRAFSSNATTAPHMHAGRKLNLVLCASHAPVSSPAPF